MPAKNTKVGDRVAQPQPYTVFVSKQAGKVAVRIGGKRAYASVAEVTLSPQALPVHITRTTEGLVIQGEGVVRQLGDESIVVTG